MRIRSVSPLIATIILIALTVAIGAIIVGWGRSYVQKQMMCTSFSLYISDYRATSSSLILTVQNTGIAIDLSRYTLQVYIISKDGSSVDVQPCSNTNTSAKCVILNMGGSLYQDNIIGEGTYFRLNLTGYYIGNLPQSAKILIQGCGDVSNTIYFI